MYEESREEEKMWKQWEDFSDMVAEVRIYLFLFFPWGNMIWLNPLGNFNLLIILWINSILQVEMLNSKLMRQKKTKLNSKL